MTRLTKFDKCLARMPWSTQTVPYVITYNPSNPPLSRLLRQYMPVLHSSVRMAKAAPNPPIVGERRCHNLRRLLMPSCLPKKAVQPGDGRNGCLKCPDVRKCITCRTHLKETPTFSSVMTGNTYNIRSSVHCKSVNLIYLIDCDRCRRVQYVGETGNTVRKRFHSHRWDVNNKSTLVARHFNEKGHSASDLKCTVIELIYSSDVQVRKRHEKFWRHKLMTNFPNGLNVFD